jgi:hypothetical protein
MARKRALKISCVSGLQIAGLGEKPYPFKSATPTLPKHTFFMTGTSSG